MPHAPDVDTLPAPAEQTNDHNDGSTHDFRPNRVRVPSGPRARIKANIAAIELLERLRREGNRAATPAEQDVLASWSGWGAVPEVFDQRKDTYANERQYLGTLLGKDAYRAAQASVLNAHYTDPEIAQAMWTALRQAGFSGGRVLEPGCGSGTFIGLAPPDAVMVGVENDPITAKIAAALYPLAQIRSEGFETTRVPPDSFAAVIGNVPFGNFTVYDPAHNPQRFSIHNHFILKSLALTAPGGYVTVLTSRYTLDSLDSRARKAMARYADLLGAVRLPSNAFKRVAGTEVVTDILMLRRRGPDQSADEATVWLNSEALDHDNVDLLVDDSIFDSESIDGLNVNEYFANHPENVLGRFALGQGLHGAPTLKVIGQELSASELAGAVAQCLSDIVKSAQNRRQGLTATADSLTDVTDTFFDPGLFTVDDVNDIPLDTLRYHPPTRSIQRWTGHSWDEQRTPKSLVAETRSLIALRDAATAVITSQRNGQALDRREHLRAQLNTLYDAYVTKHGLINRFKWIHPAPPTQESHDRKVTALEEAWRKQQGIEGHPFRGPIPDHLAQQWDEAGWIPRSSYKRRPHLDGGMKNDPGWAIVAALEIFDEDTATAIKAPIFSVDLLGERHVPDDATSITDALALSLDQHHRVDIDYIAELLDCTPTQVLPQLRGLVYPALHDPLQLVPEVTALSGNVREKLAAANKAAESNPIYADYAAALREVMPTDKEAPQIKTRPGAPWIDPTYIAQFARETFGAKTVAVDHINGSWTLECPKYQRATVAMTETWGTEKADAIEILDALCNSKSIVINRPAADVAEKAGPTLDAEATFAAQAKASKITSAFQQWIFAEDVRREALVTEFNRRFNSLRAPKHRGDHLSLPGLSNKFNPHPYQRDAVARIIAEPTVLLDHVVGAGKTGSMLMGAMELRRLGLVNQPWIVVPNHILEQVGREAKQWYPAANILLGASATDPEGRRRLAAQSAASDWDMVIVPQSLFTAIGVSNDMQSSYIQRQLDELDEQRTRATTELSKKRVEQRKKKLEARLKELTSQAGKDTGLRFEQTGCDYLIIDEAHMFKNKGRLSNIDELSCPTAAQRAEDLAMKLELLRQRRRDEARAAGIPEDQIVERVATFATGTPVANSLGELWVMQNYLRPDLLAAAGVADINDWGATFTATVSTVEVNATGTNLRPVTRVGKFCNLPELLAISSIFTDVVTRDEVPIQLPQLVDGRRRIVSITPSQEVKDFISDLGWRLDHLDPRRPDIDNQLKIANDGRNVSLDPRLAHIDAPARSRPAEVATEIMRIHTANAHRIYRDPETGLEMPRRGAFQIVFCDRGTPSKDPRQFTIYTAIRGELITRGMEPDAIRFIHDAVKPAEKLSLMRRCRTGEVSVLIGSTEKMGTGTNVQTRLIALHHVDVPWRPADLEQREGRILRQGNQNTEVEIINYVTAGAYDTVMWQKVEAKALFIEQVKRENVTVNEIEDLGGGDLSGAAAETKAIATGDPRYIKQVQLDDDVKRLQALENAHQDAAARRDRQKLLTQKEIRTTTSEIDALAPLMQDIADRVTRPAHFEVAGRSYAERKDAAAPFVAACHTTYNTLRDASSFTTKPLGVTINGIPIIARRNHFNNELQLTLQVPSTTLAISGDEILAAKATGGGEGAAAKSRGLLQRMENTYKDLPHHYTRLQHRRDGLRGELDDLETTRLGDFEHAGELATKRQELTALTMQLRLEAQSAAARQAAEAAARRLAEVGRQPGWTLHLNPAPALIAESGLPDADSYRAAQRISEHHRAAEYRDKDRGLGDDGIGL
ncbi:helicase-related protein [Mycobacterium sp. TY815]|uniref:helicase-related protein n=1 Tax=Mycobacterium sp. TY815 TaxID=3050581 RepID=UPI0027422441|nr:helicase-related protein [Mycobacterium sp. TY815]MDP7707410.1 DEAD/DEAH box helicase family protein [Mycobacterium sp. TY815]